MQGKVVVISRATSGISQVAPERLAAMGAQMVHVAHEKELPRLANYGDAELGSAGVPPAAARASLRFAQGRLCPRVCWGGTPQQLRPGRPRYIKHCHPILQASVRPGASRLTGPPA